MQRVVPVGDRDQARIREKRRLFLGVAWGVLPLQVPVVWLFFFLVPSLEPPRSALLILILLLWVNTGIYVHVRNALPERPIRPLVLELLVIPGVIWLFACLLAFLPALLLAGVLTAWPSLPAGASGYLEAAGWALIAAALAVSAYGTLIRRRWVRISSHEIPIVGLPEAFDGYRIVHLSDLHIGNFDTGRQLEKWVRMANHLEPDLVVVTGDLANSGDFAIDAVCEGLKGVVAQQGVAIVLGNHDYFLETEILVSRLELSGLRVLRNSGLRLRRGGEEILVAGVDDTWSGRADITRALEGWDGAAPVVLLAHDPRVFRRALSRGIALTLSGHTHGGQFAVPFFPRRNFSARSYKFTTGLYRVGSASLFVNRGLGTTGLPIRLGVAPEIALLTLKAEAVDL